MTVDRSALLGSDLLARALPPPPDGSRDWLPYCRQDGLPPSGTGGRRIWIRTRGGQTLASWGNMAEWSQVRHWCFRP